MQETTFQLRMSRELKAAIHKAAESHERSMNAEVLYAIKLHLRWLQGTQLSQDRMRPKVVGRYD